MGTNETPRDIAERLAECARLAADTPPALSQVLQDIEIARRDLGGSNGR